MSWLARIGRFVAGPPPLPPRHSLDSLGVPPPEMSRPAPTPPTFPPPEGYEWRVVRPFANMFLLTHSACGVVVGDAERHNEACRHDG